MAAPTWAEVWTQIGHVINWYYQLEQVANADGVNLIGVEDALTAVAEGEYAADGLRQLRTSRATFSSLLSPATIQAALRPWLFELMRVIGKPERDIPGMMFRLREYMDAQSETVDSRDVTFGAASAGGSNVGDGTIYRLTVDRYNDPLEAIHTEVKTADCVQDQNQVDEHKEVFIVRGVESERDFLQVLGSGVRETLVCVDERDTERFIQNPAFNQFTGTAPTAGVPTVFSTTTSLTGWTVTTAANASIGIDTPAVYRTPTGVTTQRHIQFTDNNLMSQVLKSTVRARFDPGTPYHLQVAVYRESTCDGNFKITLGSVTRTVAMSTLSDGAWNVVTWPGASPTTNNWYPNFQAQDLSVKFELASRTTGTLFLASAILAPMQQVDGTWFAAVGGATPFLRDDTFTFTDTMTDAGIIQWGFWRAGLGHLLSNNAAGETIADPTV